MRSENEIIVKEYLTRRSITPSSQYTYKQSVKNWDALTGQSLENLDKDSLLTWFRGNMQEKQPGTIIKYGTNLRTLYTHILKEKGLSKSKASAQARELFEGIPFKDLRQTEKKNQKLRDKLVTPQEFQILINGTSSIRTKALIAVTYESGCRKGEISSIRLKDIVQRENHWILRVDGKTGVRTVPIVNSIPNLKAWLQLHPDRKNENQYLFVNNRGGTVKPLNPRGFNSSLQHMCTRLGLRRIYPHMLRHTRLTRLAEGGLGEFQMKTFAGWTADSNMAAKYIHLTGSSHVNAVLETQGLSSGETHRPELAPFIQLDSCPNCGKDINQDMVSCPYCQFILRENVAVSQDARVSELEAKLERMETLFMDALNNPEALKETRRRLSNK